MYSQAPLRPSRSHSSPSSGSRAGFPAQERYAGSSRYDANEYGQRIPCPQPPGIQSSSKPPPKSLRSASSSSRLPRRSSRDMMPPPPLPQHHPSLYHAHSFSNLHPSSGRPREVDRRPSLQQLRSEPSQPHPSARYPHELSRSPYDGRRQPSNEHADILERMRQRGWSGVGGAGARDESLSRRSSSSSSAGGDAERWGRSASLSKADSGYSEGEEGRSGAEGYGERVLEGWSALKKAVVGFAGEATAEGGQGAQIWKNLTATLAQSVGQVQFAWGGEDDGTIGPDGETKLGRAIKEYHLSRSNSIDDVPDWLLSAAERANHRRPAARRSSSERMRPSQTREGPQTSPPRRHRSTAHEGPARVEQQGSHREQAMQRMQRMQQQQEQVGRSRGTAAERLQRMRNEKRLAASAV